MCKQGIQEIEAVAVDPFMLAAFRSVSSTRRFLPIPGKGQVALPVSQMISASRFTEFHIPGFASGNRPPTISCGLMVHALHKSASMFLYRFFDDWCKKSRMPFFSIHHTDPDRKQPPAEIDVPFVAGPIRSFQTAGTTVPALPGLRHLMQVRDPRDILVSEYFSLGWIHSDEGWSDEDKRVRQEIRSLDINEFAVRESDYVKCSLRERYQPILSLMNQPNVFIVRYEEMVLNFNQWLEGVLRAAGVPRHSAWRRRLQRQYRDEFRPGGRRDPHKRQVLPGDHRRRLTPETIERLNVQFAPLLDCLGYR
jgi:hypothetical protein